MKYIGTIETIEDETDFPEQYYFIYDRENDETFIGTDIKYDEGGVIFKMFACFSKHIGNRIIEKPSTEPLYDTDYIFLMTDLEVKKHLLMEML